MSVNRATSSDTVALYSACRDGDIKSVTSLLKRKELNIDWHYQQEYGATPLIVAVRNGHEGIVQHLLKVGADLYQQKTPDRNSCLHEAATNNRPAILRHLLNYAHEDPIGIDIQNQFGNTPLHNAARTGTIECVQMLLSAGANINMRNSNGSTPLHHACYCEHSNAEVVEILIQAGADVNACDNKDNTALIIATKRSQVELVDVLLQHNANIDICDTKGHDAISIATTKKNESILHRLYDCVNHSKLLQVCQSMCGIIAVMLSDPNQHANQLIYDGLTVLQHRGQDAAGIMTCYNKRFFLRKDNGLVRDVFKQHHMLHLRGSVGIGHCRYPTAGSSNSAEAQPFYTNSPYGITLAHNGNLTNSAKLLDELSNSNFRHINTGSDSELLLNILADELLKRVSNPVSIDAVFEAVNGLMKRCSGGYTAVVIINGLGILAFRDPHGIRPLAFGYRENRHGIDYAVASESVALDAVGFKLSRDVSPGEAIIIPNGSKLISKICAENVKLNPCIFEHVYFARPDSFIDKVSVYQARLNMGLKLADKIMRERPSHGIDVVIPIPDTSRTSALEASRRLQIPYREGFVKNRYISRTFIMPGQVARKKTVRLKLNAIRSEFCGKNVLLVDDSIVRGTTSRQIVQIARENGARSVFFASAAPAIRHPNVYGIDMPTREELIAHNRTDEEIAADIGADWVVYQDLNDLEQCVRQENPAIDQFDSSCFTGHYVTGDVDEEYLKALHAERCDARMQLKNSESRDCRTQSTNALSDEVIDLHNNSHY